MGAELCRAREIARELESGNTILDDLLTEEVCGLLKLLAATLESQCAKLNACEFALNYYREPNLYLNDGPRSPTEPILDGGLRARTALTVISGKTLHPRPVRIPLPECD